MYDYLVYQLNRPNQDHDHDQDHLVSYTLFLRPTLTVVRYQYSRVQRISNPKGMSRAHITTGEKTTQIIADGGPIQTDDVGKEAQDVHHSNAPGIVSDSLGSFACSVFCCSFSELAFGCMSAIFDAVVS